MAQCTNASNSISGTFSWISFISFIEISRLKIILLIHKSLQNSACAQFVLFAWTDKCISTSGKLFLTKFISQGSAIIKASGLQSTIFWNCAINGFIFILWAYIFAVKYIFLFHCNHLTYSTAYFKSAIVNLFVLALSENIGIQT
jgi:hypothetical protein